MDEFTDRLREAIIDPADVDVDSLKKASASAAKSPPPLRSLALVSLAYGQEIENDLEVDIRARLNAGDDVIESTGQVQLLRVLATNALILSFEKTRYSVGLVGALAVRCAHHVGWHPVHPDVEAYADYYLAQRGINVRARIADDALLPAGGDKGAAGTPEAIQAELKPLRDAMQQNGKVERERDDLIWWLMSAAATSSPGGIAHEFASLLQFIPAPLAANELLKSKFASSQEGDDTSLETPVVDVPKELHPYCPDLRPSGDDAKAGGSAWEAARTVLDQLLLLRGYTESQK